MYRLTSAENNGATAPSPTEPVEKSDTSGSFVRDGYACRPPTSRNRVRYDRSSSPVRYLIEWYTGLAWGFTATLSSPDRCPNHSAVMIDTIDADDAWWPPTLIAMSPDGAGRSRLAWSIIRVASHSTRCCTRSITSTSTVLDSTSTAVSPASPTLAVCHPPPTHAGRWITSAMSHRPHALARRRRMWHAHCTPDRRHGTGTATTVRWTTPEPPPYPTPDPATNRTRRSRSN